MSPSADTQLGGSAPYHALVTGGYGIVGMNVVEQLAASGRWSSITAVGRRPQPPTAIAGYESVDLGDPADTRRVLSKHTDITHLIFGAFQYNPDPYKEIEINVAILKNTLDALREAKAPLSRVVIYQGSKAYGALLGQMTTPAKERDPRVPGPLFYFDQEDLLHERGAEDGFATTVLRPDFIVGLGFGHYANMLNLVAIYATVCKLVGLPLRYPGGETGYRQLIQITDAALLGRATEWAALVPNRENALFNVTNGDVFRWANVWPRIAEYFELPLAPPLEINLELFMKDKATVWNEMASTHGMSVHFEDMLDWTHASILRHPTEIHTSTVKIRQAGFQECLDTEDRMFELFDEMRERNYIPTL